MHLLAEPTKVELLKQEFDKKKEELKSEARDTVIEKYGGEEHLNAPPPALLLAQTEEYVEYSRTGNVSFVVLFTISLSLCKFVEFSKLTLFNNFL